MLKRSGLSHQKLVRVYSTHDELQARMLQELLLNDGIESMISGEMLPSLYPANMGDLAKREIMVLESQVEEANRIISEAGWEEAE